MATTPIFVLTHFSELLLNFETKTMSDHNDRIDYEALDKSDDENFKEETLK